MTTTTGTSSTGGTRGSDGDLSTVFPLRRLQLPAAVPLTVLPCLRLMAAITMVLLAMMGHWQPGTQWKAEAVRLRYSQCECHHDGSGSKPPRAFLAQ